MEKACLTEVKAILKSLVLSSTDKMTIDQLNRDYRDTEGEFIPYRRLGYTSIEEFFRAIPDTLRVFGSGPTAMVCFVANEKSDHIHDMIMKQKKPKTKAKSKARPTRNNSRLTFTNNKFNNNRQPVNMNGHQFSPFQSVNRQQAVRTVRLWPGPPPLVSHPIERTVNIQNFYALPQPGGIASTIQENNLRKYEEHVKQVSNLLKNTCLITQPPPPPLPLPKSTKHVCEIEAQQFIKQIKTETKEPSEESKPATSTIWTNAEDELKNIKAPKAKDNNTRPIKLSSDIEKLMTRRRQAKFSNPFKISSSDTILEEVEERKELTKLEKVMTLKLTKDPAELFDISNEKEEQKDEAVPSFAAKSNVFRIDFPEHTVPFGTKIAAYKIPKDIEVGSCIKIFVSEIHSPFRFWIHIYKEEHELDLLMHQIERYYSALDEDDLCIPLTSLMPGQVCAASYNGMWHRGEIVAPPVNGTVKVSFMDYGTVIEVKIKEIKFLASYFAQLPAQALRGCLSHIKPRHLHWSHDATLHFLKLTSDLMLYAKITDIDTQKQILYMILCNTYDDEIVQINKSLVAHRYAFYNEEWKAEKIKKNNGQRVHHPREDFPTFSMIESGEYPNFTELFNLQRRGIDYETIHDVILYNQSSILNKHENAPECIRKLPYFLTTTNPFRSDIMLELCATTSKAA